MRRGQPTIDEAAGDRGWSVGGRLADASTEHGEQGRIPVHDTMITCHFEPAYCYVMVVWLDLDYSKSNICLCYGARAAKSHSVALIGYPNVGRSVPCAVTNSLFDPLVPWLVCWTSWVVHLRWTYWTSCLVLVGALDCV